MAVEEGAPTRSYEDWPFGNKARYVQAYLRATDPERTPTDVGYGVRIYPSARGEKGGQRVVNANKRTCSCKVYRKKGRDCVDLFEDDFRFGCHAGRSFKPPDDLIKALAITDGEPYGNARRLHARPNPTVDNKKAATIARHAREAMPVAAKELARDLAYWVRSKLPKEFPHPGQPKIDIVVSRPR